MVKRKRSGSRAGKVNSSALARSAQSGKRRRQNNTKRAMKVGAVAGAGFILICDIVGFSQMEPPEQATAVGRLFNFLEIEPFLKPRYDGYVNGTGDGALIAWSQRKTVLTHQQLLDFAQGLLAHMRGARKPVGMRIGVHVGQFRIVEPKVRRLGLQLVGTGLNECARVSSLGDEGHIIVSESFLEHWRGGGTVDYARFYPPSNEPIIAFVKHNEPLGVRVFLHDSLQKSLPEKLRRILCVDKLIIETLTEIEAAFVQTVFDPKGEVSLPAGPASAKAIEDRARALSARVGIFSQLRRRDGSKRLCGTDYRYHRDQIWRRRSTTEYAFEGSNLEGPLVRAFMHDAVQVVHALPKDYEQYVSRMAAEGIERAKVERMSRKAGAYLVFPFGLRYGSDPLSGSVSQPPEGVVCIDLDDNLAPFDKSRLEIHVTKLKEFFNTTLSVLWRLRTS